MQRTFRLRGVFFVINSVVKVWHIAVKHVGQRGNSSANLHVKGARWAVDIERGLPCKARRLSKPLAPFQTPPLRLREHLHPSPE
jgi:hypothetical protein